MSQDLERIGPAEAMAYLEKRTVGCRPPMRREIELLTNLMAQDRWEQTGNSIKIDDEGRLVDGVQRLHAVIRSGKTIEFLVQRVPSQPMEEEQDPIWVTASGYEVLICDMTDDHLLNTLRMLRRSAVRKRKFEGGTDEHWRKWASASWDSMWNEAERRGDEVWRIACAILEDKELEPAPYPKRDRGTLDR